MVLLIALGQRWREIPVVSRGRLILIAAIGCWIWFVPSLFTGVTESPPLGQGYLCLTFETFGIALVVSAALCGLRRVEHANADGVSSLTASMATAATVLLLVVLAASVSITAGLNLSLVL